MSHTLILKTATTTLSKGPDNSGNKGYWLYDHTRSMNLAIRSETEQSAFLQALEYYQKRLMDVEGKLNTLQSKVDKFVSQFADEDN